MELRWNDTDRGNSNEDWRSSKLYSVPHREHILHCKMQAINVFFSQKPSVFMVIFKHNVGANFVGIAFGRHWDFNG